MRAQLSGSRGVNVDEALTIRRDPGELYCFWRDLSNPPRSMQDLVAVRQIDARRSHWTAKAPAGRTVEWTADH